MVKRCKAYCRKIIVNVQTALRKLRQFSKSLQRKSTLITAHGGLKKWLSVMLF